jgi:glycosyltransferase involved in cell wall biosynthesis
MTLPATLPRYGSGTESRLRIAFVTDTFEDGESGGTISALRFVQALRREHEVTVLATGGRPGPGRVVLPGFQLPLHAMRANRFTMGVPRRALLAPAIERADVVHLQFPFWVSFAALACARRAGVPVLAAFHLQPENMLWNVGVRSPRLVRALYRFWVRRFYDGADAVLCPTPFAESLLRRHGLRVPTFVVSNGVSPSIRRRALPRDPAFTIMMVGRLAPEKRHDVVLEAIARSRHADRIRLVIAGAGPLEQDIRRRGSALVHPPEMTGFITDPARLERLYNTASLFVHASDVEIEGMAVLEAMSCGLPVLVADSPDSASARLVPGPDCRFAGGDAADLAARIDHLIEHPEELARLRERVYRAAQGYSFDASVRRLVDVYRRVIGTQHVASDAAIA